MASPDAELVIQSPLRSGIGSDGLAQSFRGRAQQTVCVVRPHHHLAQGVGAQLARGSLLQRFLPCPKGELRRRPTRRNDPGVVGGARQRGDDLPQRGGSGGGRRRLAAVDGTCAFRSSPVGGAGSNRHHPRRPRGGPVDRQRPDSVAPSLGGTPREHLGGHRLRAATRRHPIASTRPKHHDA